MGERDDKAGHPKRDLTDESLRSERDQADAGAAKKRDALEEEADAVVRVARQRADKVVQTARDHADRERGPQSTANQASSDSERSRADGVLEHERSSADAVLLDERRERKRYLADFVAVERHATDEGLIVERAYNDTVIAARDEFLATVSHDLRSLLGGLSLNADQLRELAPEGKIGDEMRRYAGTSQRLVARMNRIVNDLLDLASIEAGKLALFPERVEVDKIMRDTLDAFGPIAAAKHITLAADASVQARHAQLDGDRILQVLANLVSNAIKFTPADGRVTIEILSSPSELQFAVSDTGIGIPPDALQTIFERFRQVSADRRGLGLGLHISKNLVEAHGGRMWAESELGVGSTFHFALPAPVR